MFDILRNIISHTWEVNGMNSTEQQVLYYICGCLIVILTITFIDLIYRVFSHFWSGRK